MRLSSASVRCERARPGADDGDQLDKLACPALAWVLASDLPDLIELRAMLAGLRLWSDSLPCPRSGILLAGLLLFCYHVSGSEYPSEAV